MLLIYFTVALILATALLSRLVGLARQSSLKDPFPKGPKPLPLIGNLHQIPLSRSFLAFTTWSRSPQTSTHQGLVGLRLGPSSRAVVLNKWTQVRDLLDSQGRGALYSDRPDFPAAHLVIPDPPGVDAHLVFAQYGPRWRRARRTITEFLSERELSGGVLAVQDAESSQMMWEFLQFCGGATEESRGAYHRYAMRYFIAVILASVFGVRGKDSGEGSRVARFDAVQDEWAKILTPGVLPPLDVFPWMMHVPDFLTPWKGWQKRVEGVRKAQGDFYNEVFSETEAMLRNGKGEDAFVARLLKGQEKAARSCSDEHLYTRPEMLYIGGFLIEGGADTTAMAFESFILAMAAYPAVQKQAQDEVDAMSGPEQMPHTADERRLPFLKACFLEILRWRTPFPTSIPHANTADDVYDDYAIPKGTAIIQNTWAINHDPEEFENPEVFDPSRYLANPFGVRTQPARDGVASDVNSTGGRRPTYAFGGGRRVCAGSKMAENSMMMTMAKLMWAFDVLPGKTGEKMDTDIRTAYKNSLLTGPLPFSVKFSLRDERKREVIRREWEQADHFLSRFG